MQIRILVAMTALLVVPAMADEAVYVDDRSTPVAVVQSFYSAINRKEYARAWSYYQDGVGVAPFAKFVEGYADTEIVAVTLGEAAADGAAGSTYWALPVSLDAVSSGGKHSYFAGCYTLRLANPAIQSDPPFHPLHIVEGHFQSAKGAGETYLPTDCQQ